MNFTDIFIKRPVLATVLSTLILVMGLAAINHLPVRQYPATQSAVLNINTVYLGADAELIANFITAPLENAIAKITGIDYMTSSSTQNFSNINVYLKLNYDPIKALADVNAKINSVGNVLPDGAQNPVVSITNNETVDSMYIGFYSDILTTSQVTDYLLRVMQPKLQAITGVQEAELLGGKPFAMRIWLNPFKLAGFGVTAQEVALAIASNNVIAPLGRTDGNMITVNLNAASGMKSVAEFANLIVAVKNRVAIRLSDVANINLGALNYDSNVRFNGKNAVYIGIKVAPAANVLDVLNAIQKEFPALIKQIPTGLNGAIVYDASKFVASSIHEVINEFIKALIVVSVVIVLFLGSIRSVIIPLIAIPVSIIGAFFIMMINNYSINLLTLLALLLGIGLVVDDAIIVVENIQRHIEDGMTKLDAALQGARELTIPIIAISLVLIAVYLPIGFVGGLTGALLAEFAFTLAGTVAISAVVALTLSPMMCNKFLSHNAVQQHKVALYNNKILHLVQDYYRKSLSSLLETVTIPLMFAGIVLVAIVPLFLTANKELAPLEDQSIILSQVVTAPNANLAYTNLYSDAVSNIYLSLPEAENIFVLNGISGLNTSIVGLSLKPWELRQRTSHVLHDILQHNLKNITGARVAVFEPAPLPGSSGVPIQVVLKTTDNLNLLADITEQFMTQAKQSGLFIFLDSDLKLDRAQTEVVFDRDKVADLGFTIKDLALNLSSLLSQGHINYFNYSGRSYQVITQISRPWRINAQQLLNYYVKSTSDLPVQLKSFAQLNTKIVPESIHHFQQLNSATISGVPMPGVKIGDALTVLNKIATTVMPSSYMFDYAGQSRQFIQEGNSLLMTFFFALLLIFLCLAALFESFRDPLIILISVPMSVFGALIFINLGFHGASLNIYTEISLVTLIGIVSKHGILIVQFANELQLSGKTKYEAIIAAACVRLRPILITTAAMIVGVFPLLFASGAGSASSFNVGLVLSSGIAIGTLFTLFILPAVYLTCGKEMNSNGD